MIKNFKSHDCGSVAVLSAFAIMLLAGTGALVLDYGRMVVLQNQLQNYADSAAAAGAVFLDKTPDAIKNSNEIIYDALPAKYSGIFRGKSSQDIEIESVTYYSAIQPDKITTTNPINANFLEVKLAAHDVSFLMKPVLDLLTGNDTPHSSALTAHALTSGTLTACHVPPLMICDYRETHGSDYDVLSEANIGRQVKLIKESGTNTLAPGNFGILDTPSGSQASQDISEAMASLDPSGCYGQNGIDTAPGVRAGPLSDGINARFDLPSSPNYFGNPAPNVIHYPRDANINSEVMGNGSWDFSAYWADKHPTKTIPEVLGTSPSRYQVYLYELGEKFALSGKRTLYPAPDILPSGYTLIDPKGKIGAPSANCVNGGGKKIKGQDPCDTNDPSIDGVAEQNTPVDDPRRRVVEVVVLKCVSDNVKGNGGPYPDHGQFIELFLTESVDSTHTIYGEVLRRITLKNSEKLYPSISYHE